MHTVSVAIFYNPSGTNKYVNIHFTEGYQVVSVFALTRYGAYHIYIGNNSTNTGIYGSNVETIYAYHNSSFAAKTIKIEAIDETNIKLYMEYHWDAAFIFGLQFLSGQNKVEFTQITPQS